MKDNDVIEFIKAYNEADEKPESAMEFLLFIEKHDFAIYKKERA